VRVIDQLVHDDDLAGERSTRQGHTRLIMHRMVPELAASL
jgi:hypothetical protein